MLETSLLSLFLAGLLGGVHCVGMCGGIVGAITVSSAAKQPRWLFYLSYNTGRICSYALIGVVAGTLGSSAYLLAHLLPVQKSLYLFANLIIILLGLYLAGIWNVLASVEKAGGLLWRRISPAFAKLLPVRTLFQGFLVGMLWGWLPCGLVYTALISALASGDGRSGGLAMLAFGLGTLPNLLSMGFLSAGIRAHLQNRQARLWAGLFVVGLGVNGIIHMFR